jgi:hypothetical protein
MKKYIKLILQTSLIKTLIFNVVYFGLGGKTKNTDFQKCDI